MRTQAPFAGLLLADFGATVLRVDRPPASNALSAGADALTRHKSSIILDLKSPSALSLLRSLLQRADVFIDPYRPGVIDSLGLEPETLLKDNSRLIIARLTGFRRSGAYAQRAGHDINYLAVNGVLSQLGPARYPPYPPANILADFAGGGLMCAVGVLLALISRAQTGKGQIVECNMVDGAAYLATFLRLGRASIGDRPRGENLLDGGCPWYQVYECKCGGYMAVGALEEKFFAQFIRGIGLDEDWLHRRHDRDAWPVLKALISNCFMRRTRRDWEAIFDGKDACCTPVLSQDELEEAGYEQGPAVTLKNTPSHPISQEEGWKSEGLIPGTGGEDILSEWTGWSKGRHYTIQDGGLVSLISPNL